MNNSIQPSSEFLVNPKIKLAALWTTLMFLYIYADYFDMKAPGEIQRIINLETPVGDLTPTLLLVFSIIVIVPALMISLSLVLKPVINKWVNILVSSLWSTMSFLLLFNLIGDRWYMFYVLFLVIEIVIFFAIIRVAWKWA